MLWTLVVKTGHDKALVQIAKTSIKTTSLYTGLAVVNLDASKVKELNEGFNFEFDFKKGKKAAIEAYEALISGNATLAQELARKSLVSGVSQVDSFVNKEFGSKRRVTIGIPMVAIYNWTTGRVFGETATKTYLDKTTTDLNYGIYFKEEKGRFFHKHKRLLRSFYAAKASTKDANNKHIITDESATYLWSFESDNSTSAKLRDAFGQFHEDLGLKNNFNPVISSRENLGYVKLEAKVDIPSSYTRRLHAAVKSNVNIIRTMENAAEDMIIDYINHGDNDDLCRRDADNSKESPEFCKRRLISETKKALRTINATLVNLKNKSNASEYTFTYAQLGKELIRNQFVMNSFFALDKACEVKFEVKLEGHRVSKMTKKIPANLSCR